MEPPPWPSELLSDPTWEMMLDLYDAALARKSEMSKAVEIPADLIVRAYGDLPAREGTAQVCL